MKTGYFLLTLIISNTALAAFNMDQVDKKYAYVKPPEAGKEECIIRTMPKTRSQDGLGICYAAAAATLVDEYRCYKKNNTKCTEVPDNERMSQLDIARYSQDIKDDDERRDRDNYKGIKIGGATYLVLLQNWYVDSVVPESCAPMDKAIIGIEDNSTIQEALWQKLEKFYLNMKKGCAICDITSSGKTAEEVKKEFKLHQSPETIAKAMAESTWEKALDQLLIPQSCKEDWKGQLSAGNLDLPKYFPANGQKSDFKGHLNKIKSVTCENKRPVALNFCAGDLKKIKSTKACENERHAVVIEGYREVCDTNKFSAKTTKCKPMLKVRNSWGEGWQKANNDGWVDAKKLLDATFYDEQPMTWLEKNAPVQY